MAAEPEACACGATATRLYARSTTPAKDSPSSAPTAPHGRMCPHQAAWGSGSLGSSPSPCGSISATPAPPCGSSLASDRLDIALHLKSHIDQLITAQPLPPSARPASPHVPRGRACGSASGSQAAFGFHHPQILDSEQDRDDHLDAAAKSNRLGDQHRFEQGKRGAADGNRTRTVSLEAERQSSQVSPPYPGQYR
jgi:hypothetical protein